LSPVDGSVTAALLLDHYLNPITDPDELAAAAILIRADGRPWNTVEHSEGFHHIGFWLSTIAALLTGETSACIWAFEECGLEVMRHDEWIYLEERTHHAAFQLPPACFQLRPFAETLLAATRVGVEPRSEPIAPVASGNSRGGAGTSLALIARVSRCGVPLPPDAMFSITSAIPGEWFKRFRRCASHFSTRARSVADG
jgi:hypothetical protein